jgi:hypothetical protein
MVSFNWRRLRGSLLIRLFVPNTLLAALRLGWVILVIWAEIGIFLYTLSVCRWPGLAHHTVSSPCCTLIRVSEWPDRSIKDDTSETRPTHILLVADAQVPMRHSHPQTFTGLFHDIYMRRAWKITHRLHPHLVFFLGDMLKSGRSVESDDE